MNREMVLLKHCISVSRLQRADAELGTRQGSAPAVGQQRYTRVFCPGNGLVRHLNF